MDDLFADEQKILDDALLYATELKDGAAFEPDRYHELVREYRRILKLLRRNTKMSDRSAFNLYKSNLDLSDKVHYDALTGIYNRRYLDNVIEHLVSLMCRAKDAKLSVMMIDLDFFKNYNDTYGHSAGDDCLKTIANALSSTALRADDFVARYGGEEFTAIMPNTDENGARLLAEKMINVVRAHNIPHEKSEIASFVTISIGVTTGTVERSQSGFDYIKRADEALYMSKLSGRNRYTYLSFEKEVTQ